ncbi:MAG: hypothetical protein Q8O87_00800 [bacterium]|nr:hypothetical protein [bacterium]
MRVVNPIPWIKEEYNKVLSLIKNGNRFLVIEILNHELKATLIKADFTKRTFNFIKSKSEPIESADYNYENIAAKLEEILSVFGKLQRFKILLNLDPRLATTIYSGVALVRDNNKDPIDDGDLDNLISRAIWGFFDRHRSKVAAKLGINDLDVILSDVQVNGIKLDGHKVINPIGFQAKSVELQLSLTFTVRDLINRIKNILPKENIVFISEDGSAWSHLLSGISESDRFILANVFLEETTLFSVHGSALGYLDTFDWGKANLSRALMDKLSVNKITAERILEKYSVSDASPTFIKKLESLIIDELTLLIKGLEHAMGKADVRQVYLNPFFAMPPVVFSNYFKNKFSKSIKLKHVHNGLVSQKFNHELKLKDANHNAVATLTGVLMGGAMARNEHISKIAKRRIRWLI